MWVLKLGGSLLGSGALQPWLAWLARQAAAPVVVVPGGGPYADAVRRLQSTHACDDLTAHRQAMLAMQQFGWLLLSGCPAATPLHLDEAIAGRLQAGLKVWLPEAALALPPALPPDWRTTSDALSLHLAAMLGAHGVMLVKSLDGASLPASAVLAAERGVIDEASPALGLMLDRPVWCLAPTETDLASAIMNGAPVAHRRLHFGASH